MQKILILGGSGLIGTAIINEMKQYSQFEVYSTYHNHMTEQNQDRSFQLSIEEPNDIDHILNMVKPDMIVSCLRGDFKKQLLLHTISAEYLKKQGGSLYYFSTTNVFDQDSSRPHTEEDTPKAQSEYGQFKLECERKMIDILQENACIIRIPQVWGKNSPRMRELLEALNKDKKITVYPKLFHNTNTDGMIAKQICYVIQNDLKGTFHLVPEDVINYKDFYTKLITGLGFRNAKLNEDFEEEGYFALLSHRYLEFPEQLRFTNEMVIHDLCHENLGILTNFVNGKYKRKLERK